MQKNNKAASSTQSHLAVSEIREGTIVIKDGSLRAVLVVSSTQFFLKSADEQNALIGLTKVFEFLGFPVQDLIQSRKLDINAYLDKLRGIMQQQTNEFLNSRPRNI